MRMDRPAGAESLGRRGGGHVRHLRRHSRHAGQSDRRHGRARLSRLELAVEGRPSDRVRAGLSRYSPTTFRRRLLYLLYQAAGTAPMIPLDDKLRPTWLFGETVHDGCDRGGYYEAGQVRRGYGTPECLVKIGCWGPVVKCNVTKRGWMDGIGGCPNVGGICIACTMPGFPDKFMPFMDEPPGAQGLIEITGTVYGPLIRALRQSRSTRVDKEPKWRHPGHKADDRLPAVPGA